MQPDRPSDPPIQFIEFRGSRLAYADEGEGDNVVVAIPGLPGRAKDFLWLASAFSKRIRLVRIELPGFGQSQRTGATGMAIAQRAEPVQHLIRKLALEPVTLLGHSSGATVVAQWRDITQTLRRVAFLWRLRAWMLTIRHRRTDGSRTSSAHRSDAR